MNVKNKGMKQSPDVNMGELVSTLWNRKWLIIAIMILCAEITYICTACFLTPKYQSSVLFYVNNASFSAEGIVRAITSDDIRVSKHMVDTYAVILNTRTTLDEVIENAQIDAERHELSEGLAIADFLQVERENETELFRVFVTWEDQQEAERIANAIGEVLPKRIDGIINDTSARIADYAVLPTEPVAPSARNNTILGALLGFVLAAGLIALHYLFDERIRSAEALSQYTDTPILAMIPTLGEEED